MTYCQPSTHTKQTILRGCCNTGNNCCNNVSSYDARTFNDCTDTNGNTEQTYATALCQTLASTRGPHTGYTGFYTTLNSEGRMFNRFNCGTFHVYVEGATDVLVATVENGIITPTNTPFATGVYDVVLEELPGTPCASITITN